jgi:2'-5' RNA ligase superfamily
VKETPQYFYLILYFYKRNCLNLRLKLIKKMTKTRTQLTLFINEKDAKIIEEIRQKFNPKQYALIKSHVTLCREDELENMVQILHNLTNLNQESVTIQFGNIIRFSDKKGVLIPALKNNKSFQDLRKNILKGIIENPRIQEPHITLMHPRNATCTDEIFAEIKKYDLPNILNFTKISLIEQEIGRKWRILKEYELKNTK